ncbi:uncharacterized protein LOC142350945 [Convolutriloba macropyga]|uniref:uncharacterized protein LOC142350945 n=1 Tax=Convolutriloba macropyga TaxID=536237 RepID=UPI003F51C114
MEEVPRNKIQMPATNCFYLPHPCVIKDASRTTELRVVFNASAESASGVSLNDPFLVGPQLQKDLFGMLIRFRFRQVALSADIVKMYRQVQLDDEDMDFTGFLWKNPNDTEVKTYRMTRVTYGIASSSHHSIRTLKALADSCTNSNLRLAINNDMYLGDLLTGASDIVSPAQLPGQGFSHYKEEVTELFDPLGWLSPTTNQLKSFLQILWMDKLTWDETLSLIILAQYERFRLQLKELEKIKLERRVFAAPFSSSLELHVFCDASTTAYAAVVYVQVQMDD